MPVTVEPSTFTMVDFDADRIAELGAELAAKAGIADDVPVRIEVDERTPLAGAELVSHDPVVHVRVESGALESTKRIRQLDDDTAADALGRMLLRAADRRRSDFADAPAESDLTVPQRTTWDVYAVGRIARMGYPVRRQRYLYAFRNRHGFTDAADGAFEELWSGDDLGWADLDRLSETTAQSNPGALAG